MKKLMTLPCAVLLMIACVTSCSTKSRLVGWWSYSATGLQEMPAARWEFRSDNTCYWNQGSISSGKCGYTIRDDGTIKITFQSGQTGEGILNGGRLTIKAFGDQFVLTKE